MDLSEEKISLAKKVLKEIDEMEAQKRENQYKNLLEAYSKQIKDTCSTIFYYDSILYDEVRQRLEQEGFKVRTVTRNNYYAAYLITKKEDFAVKEEVVRIPLE